MLAVSKARWPVICGRSYGVLLHLLLGCSIAQAGEWVSETQPSTPEAQLCRELLQRLRSVPERCATDALETYAQFSSPPWQTLDPNEHLDLLTRLILNRSGPPRIPISDLTPYGPRALDFIKRGGELRVWHTRLMSNDGGGAESVAPPGDQVVVLMLDKIELQDPREDCPGKRSKGWQPSTFVVLPDLSGPDPQVERGLAHALTLMQPVLYRGETLLIESAIGYQDDGKLWDGSDASVWKNFDPAGLRPVCSFRFNNDKPQHRKDK
jgi:hypothetical protein